MNRTFLSLYLLLVFSVVGVGWGIDKLWQAFNPESTSETNVYVDSLVRVLEENLRLIPADKMQARAEQLLGDTPLKFHLFDVDEFADSQLGNDILQGDVVAVFADSGDQRSYKRIRERSKVICLTLTNEKSVNSYIYESLLVAFYLAIALVIYFWVWPLSKDLRELEMQTRRVGKDGVPAKVNLGKRSTIYELAGSFNKMSERIRELISSHKEMTYAVSHEMRTPLARYWLLRALSRANIPSTKNPVI